MAFSRAAAMSSPAWIALSMAAISRTLVEGTWLKMLRYQCTTHLCQAASRKNSAALSASPMQASEVISRTPFNPRSLRCLRNGSSPSYPPSPPRKCRESPDNRARSRRSQPAARRCAPRQPSWVEQDAVEINIRFAPWSRVAEVWFAAGFYDGLAVVSHLAVFITWNHLAFL